MSQVSISSRTLSNLKADSKPYFLRDTIIKGFGVKVNPSGSVKYIAEVKHKGRASRKTLGQYPILALSDARREALAYPICYIPVESPPLQTVLLRYCHNNLKTNLSGTTLLN